MTGIKRGPKCAIGTLDCRHRRLRFYTVLRVQHFQETNNNNTNNNKKKIRAQGGVPVYQIFGLYESLQNKILSMPCRFYYILH